MSMSGSRSGCRVITLEQSTTRGEQRVQGGRWGLTVNKGSVTGLDQGIAGQAGEITLYDHG